jgi:hypothetical protein
MRYAGRYWPNTLPLSDLKNSKGSRLGYLVSKTLMKMGRRSLIALVALAIMAPCGLALYEYQLRRRADELIRAAYELSQQEKSPTAQDLQRRFGSALTQTGACSEDGCGYEVVLTNQILAILRLARPTVLKSSFWLEHDVLLSNHIQFWTRGAEARMILSYVEIRYCAHCSFFRPVPSSGRETIDTNGSVDIGSASPTDKLRIALGFDTQCLTAFRGCPSIAELLPSVWSRDSAQTIQLRVPEWEGPGDDGSAR